MSFPDASGASRFGSPRPLMICTPPIPGEDANSKTRQSLLHCNCGRIMAGTVLMMMSKCCVSAPASAMETLSKPRALIIARSVFFRADMVTLLPRSRKQKPRHFPIRPHPRIRTRQFFGACVSFISFAAHCAVMAAFSAR